MRRVIKEIYFDLKNMGWHFAGILSICLFVIVGSIILKCRIIYPDQYIITVLPLVQILISAAAGYGSVMLMQSLLDTEGGEMCFTFPRSNLYWGIVRQIRYFVIILPVIICVCIPISLFMKIKFGILLAIITFQSVAVMAVSFIGVSISRKVSIGLVFLIAFIGIQITLGQEYEVFNFIYIPFGKTVETFGTSKIIFNAIIISIVGFIWGQTFIHPEE